MKDLIRQEVDTLKPYEPGRPISQVKRDLGLEDVIKLASNECPYPPFPQAETAMREAVHYVNRYPDGGSTFLKEKLAAHLNVSAARLMIGHGSNELIRLLANVILRKGDEAVMANPSFVVYPMVVKLMAAKPVEVPLAEYRHDLAAMLKAVTKKTKLVFICNPNNPTGTIVYRSEVDEFMSKLPENIVVVFDEAYFELVDSAQYPNGLDYLDGERPVVVFRTFSKVYGLAGCRIGYGIAPEFLVEAVNKAREPFNVNSVAQIGALFSLGAQDEVERRKRLNFEARDYLYGEFERLGLDYVPTEANFILVDVGRSGRKVWDALMRRGVIVRPGDIFGYPTHLRVTIGTPEENQRFVSELEGILEH